MAVTLPHPKQSSIRSARIGGLCRQTRVTNALAGCAATRNVGMDRMAATPAAMGAGPGIGPGNPGAQGNSIGPGNGGGQGNSIGPGNGGGGGQAKGRR
jgi:hypothetical protein